MRHIAHRERVAFVRAVADRTAERVSAMTDAEFAECVKHICAPLREPPRSIEQWDWRVHPMVTQVDGLRWSAEGKPELLLWAHEKSQRFVASESALLEAVRGWDYSPQTRRRRAERIAEAIEECIEDTAGPLESITLQRIKTLFL